MSNEASAAMNLPPIDKKMNINTIIMVAGFALTFMMTIGGMVWTSSQLAGQISSNTKMIMDYRATTDSRIAAIEADTRQIDNLAYRINAAEGANIAVSKSLEDLKAAVSEQSGDLKLVREILQRLDRQSSPTSFSPTVLR
ncbi:MAG: hypothetical protein ACOH2T_29205 [Pseudomonas sp.]